MNDHQPAFIEDARLRLTAAAYYAVVLAVSSSGCTVSFPFSGSQAAQSSMRATLSSSWVEYHDFISL